MTAEDTSYHIPIRYKVNQKQTECLYDRFEQGEVVTFSVFVVEALLNGKPKCNVMYQGPLTKQTTLDPNNRMTLGRMIRQALLKKDTANNKLDHRIKVDWSHAGEEEDELLIREEIHRENRHRRHNNNEHSGIVASPKIEPYEITHKITVSGYYRVCAQAELQALVVEMDARSSSRMGGVDQETGHVYTHAKRDLLNEEAAIDKNDGNNNNKKNGQLLDSNTYQSKIEELSKVLVNQVEDSDLTRTKEQLKDLNAKTSDIMTEIQNRMKRIRSHEGSAKRNSVNLAWSSKMETMLFAVISGFQVLTIRKWLLANTQLGR